MRLHPRAGYADEAGARLAGDPLGLASALAKLHASAEMMPRETATPATASLFIVSPLAPAGGILSWFSTHPPVEERIRRLHDMARSGAWSDRGAGQPAFEERALSGPGAFRRSTRSS